MNCTKCGRKNADGRLFCGFCGSPLERQAAPDAQDEQRRIYGRPEQAAPEAEPAQELPRRAARHAKKDEQSPQSDEETLAFDPPIPPREDRPQPADELFADGGGAANESPEPLEEQPAADIPEEEQEAFEDPLAKPLLDKPVQLRAKHPPQLTRNSAPVRPRAASGPARANTATPVRLPDMDDMFMEDETDAEDDIADFVREYFDDYSYEEPAHGNFFVRHIRGFVALTLLALTVIIVGYWLLFGSGQRVLGQLYLSGDPQIYRTLGSEAEAVQDYETAGSYYLKALELEPTDRDTAIYAANAYIRAGNSGKAAEALEYMIAMDPTDVDPYVTLKQLYPDAASRPQRITQLIQQGYEQTGDTRLQE